MTKYCKDCITKPRWRKRGQENNLPKVPWLVSACYCCLVAKSCPNLCSPMDCSPPGSSVHGISQARILEWAAITFSRGFSWLQLKVCLLHCRRILCHWVWVPTEAQLIYSHSRIQVSVFPSRASSTMPS